MPIRPVTPRPPSQTWAACAVLFAGTILLFSRSLGYDFINYDDPAYVTSNPHVQAGLTWDSLVWAFTGSADYWHPLTWLSHMLDWQLFGANATGHRAVSVLWHAANAALVFLVLRRLTGAWWTAWVSAALFAWHPLRVESVVWVTERKDVMSGCFFLLTLWAYAGYAEQRRAGRPARGRYGLALLLFVLGLMCKPMLVTVPVVLLLLDWWPLGRFAAAPAADGWPARRRIILEKLPFVFLAVAVAGLTLHMQRTAGAFVLDLPLGARLGNAVVSVARYLGLFFWPAGLAVCYPHPGHWPWPEVAGAAMLTGVITVTAWLQHDRRPWLLTGWLVFLVMLLPTLGLVQVGAQAMADRYTYLPILGVELGVLWTLRAWRWPRGVAIAATGIVLAVAAAATWRQQAVWRDPETLFRHALAVTRDNSIACSGLGFTFFEQGRLDEAAALNERALEIEPRNQPALNLLATIRAAQQRYPEAINWLERLLQVNPAEWHARLLLGTLHLHEGQTEKGLVELRRVARSDLAAELVTLLMNEADGGEPGMALAYASVVLEANPREARAHQGRAVAFARLGRTAEALDEFRQALALDPLLSGAATQAGLALLNAGRAAESLDYFVRAVANAPDDPAALAGQGRALEQVGRTAEAAAAFQRALLLAPRNPELQRAWAGVLAGRRRFPEAAEAYRRLLALRPDDAAGHAGLGDVLALTGRRAEAARQWAEALRLNPGYPGLRERLQQVEP